MAIQRRINDGNATLICQHPNKRVRSCSTRSALSPEHFKRVQHADVFRLGVWGWEERLTTCRDFNRGRDCFSYGLVAGSLAPFLDLVAGDGCCQPMRKFGEVEFLTAHAWCFGACQCRQRRGGGAHEASSDLCAMFLDELLDALADRFFRFSSDEFHAGLPSTHYR